MECSNTVVQAQHCFVKGFAPPRSCRSWLRASALTCRLISLVVVKWSCLRINQTAFPPVQTTYGLSRSRTGWRAGLQGYLAPRTMPRALRWS